MSATAKLIFPNSLMTHGTHFKKGVDTPVDYSLAAILKRDKRFEVAGLDTLEAVTAAARASRPEGSSLMAAIREAADGLDVDDESNFTASGKPSHLAVGAALGFPISADERDRAMGKAASPVATETEAFKGKLDAVEGAAPARKPLVVKTKPAVDPTTEGALNT